MGHPALYESWTNPHRMEDGTQLGHFVPEGWEDANVGICPCGEVVSWDSISDRWLPDRETYVFIVDRKVGDRIAERFPEVELQYDIQNYLRDLQDAARAG